jgi:hypothetical protein
MNYSSNGRGQKSIRAVRNFRRKSSNWKTKSWPEILKIAFKISNGDLRIEIDATGLESLLAMVLSVLNFRVLQHCIAIFFQNFQQYGFTSSVPHLKYCKWLVSKCWDTVLVYHELEGMNLKDKNCWPPSNISLLRCCMCNDRRLFGEIKIIHPIIRRNLGRYWCQ